MRIPIPAALALALLVSALPAAGENPPPAAPPSYSADGKLRLPEDYRQWVYLSTGFDMSYNPAMRMGHHMFDNVFVNPEAYRAFVATGTWPDRTVLVLEVRGAQDKGSINKLGQYQDSEVMGLEIHVRDDARFPGRWAFFAFEDGQPASAIPQNADCYSCHAAHGAVDTTFTQFYPTLIPIATAKGTLSAGYLRDEPTQP